MINRPALVILAAAAVTTVQLEDYLFILNPPLHRVNGSIHVVWIPQPLQKYCLGKTVEQCTNIDYCVRTTDQNVATCRNLGIDLSRLPKYPAGMRPRRLLSIIYFQVAPIQGFDKLQKFFDSAPKNSLDRLSTSARIKARIKLTRSADDDDFDLLEVLAVPPF